MKPPKIALHSRPGRPRKHEGLSPRERLDLAKAERQEADNRFRAGQLVERDDVHRANVEHGAQVRGRLLNMGNELGPALANLDARQIKAELDRWATDVLTQWANWAEDRTDG